jgi:hypothetical protein
MSKAGPVIPKAGLLDDPSSDEYIGRSPGWMRAGLGAARRSALLTPRADPV